MSKELLFFLFGLFMTIPLSIAGNVLTRKYDDVMAKRSISVRGKRLETLTKEFQHVRKLAKSPTHLAFDMYFETIRSITLLTLLVLVMVGSSLLLLVAFMWQQNMSFLQAMAVFFVALVFALVSFILFNYLIRANAVTDKLLKYDEYEEKVFTQIEKLGGNVEELLKEDETATQEKTT